MRRKSQGSRYYRPADLRLAANTPEHIRENPNAGKRRVARLATMEGFIAELARAESRAYSPLTVSTPVYSRKTGRPDRRYRPTSYTI